MLFPLALFLFFFSHPHSTITLKLTLSPIYLLPSFIGNLSTTIATLRCLGPPRRDLIFNKNFDKFGLDYKIRKNIQLLKSILVTLVMSLSTSRVCLGVDIEVS